MSNHEMPKALKTRPLPRNRLEGEVRSLRVLDAAYDLFLAHGYSGVSLEMIVKRAGGSYRDIYQQIGGKDALFLQVMERASEEVLAPLRDVHLDPDSGRASTEDVLRSMGMGILRTLLLPRTIALTRLVFSEAARFPELAKSFATVGPAAAYRIVADYLRTQRPTLSDKESLQAAEVFLDSIVHKFEIQALSGSHSTEAERSDRVNAAVRLFLTGLNGAET